MSHSFDRCGRSGAFVSRQVIGVALLALGAFFTGVKLHAQVVINEVLASNRATNFDEDGSSSDWVELRNQGPEAVDLAGYSLSDSATDPRRWVFPEITLEAGDYLLVWCSGKDRTQIPTELIVRDDSPIELDANLISTTDSWRYLSGSPADAGPPAAWHALDFDDAGWAEGPPAIGFGHDDVRSEVPEGVQAIFLRRTFELSPTQQNLILELRFDDGFVAYLNGTAVVADNFPLEEEPTFASLAERSHSMRSAERYDLSDHLPGLEAGANVLAIAVLNVRASSNDLAVIPALGRVPPVLHTNFRLDAGGDVVFLVDADGEVVDVVSLPPQVPDQSYGRSPDGEGEFLYHLMPTPRLENEGATGSEPLIVADTFFSHDRGFYEAPFDVEISTETPGARIRYTLDGSEPDLANGFDYEASVRIETTTVLRARAFRDGLRSTNVDTQTYLFVDQVVEQSNRSAIEAGFPSRWGSVVGDYAMDTDVIGPNDRFDGVYAESIREDLRSLPTMSIVAHVDDLFGPRGIYTNSGQGGIQWERPASIEMISAEGESLFQEDCGLRIQGGFFRQPTATPKHSFRLLFKAQYGPTKLRHDLFGRGAVDEFDTLTLRAGANDGYSWNAARLTEQYTRDEFGRELQLATGNAASHGLFVHLYVNGLYWGLYNPAERPDHSFSASYYGGDKEDWDAVHDLTPTNGDTAAWTAMARQASAARNSLEAYQELQGLNPDGTRNPDYSHLLDVPNYVDYLTVNIWGGNWDWPWKNWWAGRDRGPNSTGFKFYSWDFENTMGNNRGRSPLGMNSLQNNFTSAGVPHQSLRTNPEYRLLFADRVQRLFFDGGPLTPESLIPRFEAISERVERAIVAESARWGDQHHSVPLTLRDWTTERDWLLGSYLPERTGIVLTHLMAAGLYPRLEAPVFSHRAGLVPAGTRVLARPVDGTIYFTVDGSDPRLPGGAVAPSALALETREPEVLLAADFPARILVPTDDSLGLEWIEPDFDDASWTLGEAAVGYETGEGYEELIGTNLLEEMEDQNASVYLRIPFELSDPSELLFLTLRMRYDDGYAAYLNGERIAAVNVREPLDWDSRASRSHPDSRAVEFEDLDLGAAASLLRPGRNVLAIHGLNSRATDADFLLHPNLVATRASDDGLPIEASTIVSSRVLREDEWSALNRATYVVDQNIPLRVTELMFHPEGDEGSRFSADEFEFVELQNVGGESLDLSEVRLLGGIEFDFGERGTPALRPGEYLVLVENVDAFRSRYPDAESIAGQYRGRLGNDGDSLRLEGALGEPILEFRYEPWFPETDGAGRSLVIRDPRGPRASWNQAESWAVSDAIGGSPGSEETLEGGRQRPGDANQDGRVNVSDAVRLLRLLFRGEGLALPCAGDRVDQGGNRTLLDLDSDGEVILTDAIVLLEFLFRAGPPPARGFRCTRIVGCEERCDDI